MAITRTAKGTVQAKSGLTSTIGSVQIDAGALLEVTLGYEDPGGNPTSVKYGNKEMTLVASTNQLQGDTRVRKYRFKVRTSRTKDIVATWATDPTARCMFATEIKEASVNDGSGGQGQALTTALDTTNVGTTTVADTYQSAAFACGGPTQTVTPGTGWTLGQQVATSGGLVGTNVLLFELYRIASATESIQATATLTTARICASCVVAYRARETWTLDLITQPGFRAGPLGNAAVFRWSNGASEKHEVVVPADLFEPSTNQELIDFCIQNLQLKSEVDDDEDPTVETLDGTRVTALEGSTVVL